MTDVKRIAIIGNGCAAAECIIALRKHGYYDEIRLFADNRNEIANPMLTTYYASRRIPFEYMFPYGDAFYGRFGVDFRYDCPVMALKAAEKRLEAGGESHPFDLCLIASGASALRPPIPGAELDRVLTVRTVEDAVQLRRAGEEAPKKVLVVGASMVGIKVVEMFHRMGCGVVLADLAPYIFPLAASPKCAAAIERRLTNQGVELLMGAGLERIEARENGIAAYFTGREAPVEAEYLAMCVGVRSNMGFVDQSEIQVDRGVLVSETMQTNIPYIYAAGDVAQGRNLATGQNQIIGLLANARMQGRTAGRHMCGLPSRYEGNLLHNITHFMGMDFVGLGEVRSYDRVEERFTEDCLEQFFYTADRLTGYNSLDFYGDCGVLKNTMLKQYIQGEKSAGPGSADGLTALLAQLEVLEKVEERKSWYDTTTAAQG